MSYKGIFGLFMGAATIITGSSLLGKFTGLKRRTCEAALNVQIEFTKEEIKSLETKVDSTIAELEKASDEQDLTTMLDAEYHHLINEGYLIEQIFSEEYPLPDCKGEVEQETRQKLKEVKLARDDMQNYYDWLISLTDDPSFKLDCMR